MITLTRIKICGLFREADLEAVNEARPDYIGFVFASSRRQVTVGQARSFSRMLATGITAVGVFVNPEPEQVISLCREGVIQAIQLHGQETEALIRQIKQKSGCPVIKAIRMDNRPDLSVWQNSDADFLLLDNGSGGTGQAFDWSLMPRIEKPCFLAGGIDAENLLSALQHQPYGIDISSGAETDGRKDRIKILQLVSLVRSSSTDKRP